MSDNSSVKSINRKDTAQAPGRSDAALPSERDTAPEADAPHPRKKMQQAAQDLRQGQVDTDQHGERGIDQAVNPGNVTPAPKSSHD